VCKDLYSVARDDELVSYYINNKTALSRERRVSIDDRWVYSSMSISSGSLILDFDNLCASLLDLLRPRRHSGDS
jgi:hypothetical protein